MKCLNYAVKDEPSFGGLVIVLSKDEKMPSVFIANQTGMGGYIPENILVYIATHRDYRGKSLGKMMMNKTLKMTQGDVKLHVEHDDPARFLYRKIGFTSNTSKCDINGHNHDTNSTGFKKKHYCPTKT